MDPYLKRLEVLVNDYVAEIRSGDLLLSASADTITKRLALYDELAQIFRHQRTITQRGLYYKLAKYFNNQSTCNSELKKALKAIDYEQDYETGIIPASKGMLWDLNMGSILITPKALRQLQPLNYDTVIIIEKYSIFSQLLVDFGHCPHLALITGRGYPDKITIAAMNNLMQSNPRIKFWYLGDHDPFGYRIYLNYLSQIVNRESWLHLVILPLHLVEYSDQLEMNPRDIVVLQNLVSTIAGESDIRLSPLVAQLHRLNWKCELEAFARNNELSKYLLKLLSSV